MQNNIQSSKKLSLNKTKQEKSISEESSKTIVSTQNAVKQVKLKEFDSIEGYKSRQLQNGAIIASRIKKDITNATVIIGFRGGAKFGSVGLAHLTEHILLKNAEFNLASVKNDLICNNVKIGATTSKIGLKIKLTCPIDKLEKYVPLVCSLILNNEFDKEVFEREKKIVENERQIGIDNIYKDNLNSQYYSCFAESERVRDFLIGTSEDLKNYSLDDVIDYKNKYFNLDNLVIVADIKDNLTGFYQLIENNLIKKLDNAKSPEYVASLKYQAFINNDAHLYNILKRNGNSANITMVLKNNKVPSYKYLVAVSLYNFFLSGSYGENRQRLRDELALCYSRNTYEKSYVGNYFIGGGANCLSKDARKVIITQLNLMRDFFTNGIDENEFANFKYYFLNKNERSKNNFYSQLADDSLFDYYCGFPYITNSVQEYAYNFINDASLEDANAILKEFYKTSNLAILIEGDIDLKNLPSPNVIDAIFKGQDYNKMYESLDCVDEKKRVQTVKYFKSNYNEKINEK
ncbi:MAG: insulinase family protein [Clostridia bacterium]|nr:insulinase family protein [Clostridia bacterium]